MKATEASFLAFIKKSTQFLIPIYQRTYSWTKNECRQLWEDIVRTGNDRGIPNHFTGSIVYIERGLYQVTGPEPLLVIDGQQRMTTLMLLLEALARHIGEKEPVEGFSARKIRNYYLLNPEEEGERNFKLLLTQTDKSSFLKLLQQREGSQTESVRIKSNFEFFNSRIEQLGSEDLEALCKGLAKLSIVDVALNREHDNPQLIFESMNSTGRELSQADLIRNFVLMGLEPKKQTQLYETHWRPMEVTFGQEAYGSHFDSFMRHYLTVKTGEIPKITAVYESFKVYTRSGSVVNSGIESLLADIHKYSRYYCALALGQEKNRVLGLAFQDLRELKVDVAFPFLLELYDDFACGILDQDGFEQTIRYIEAYVFRRAICGIPTNSLNKTFATFARALSKRDYVSSIKAHFLILPSYKRFPSDEEFSRDLQTRDLYHFARRSYWLRRLENHDRKERVSVQEYTIEHIMPQNENLSEDWIEELGEDWKEIHGRYLHTLGNLTLTAYNSEYSDRTFVDKRDMQGGFGDSPLRLNQDLSSVDRWDERAILNRASSLANLAVKVWGYPDAPAEMERLVGLGKAKTPASNIDDYQTLRVGSSNRRMYDALRNSILDFGPGISEEFLKHYIAFKAETNFVDVVPQQSRLLLILNMSYHELDDPQGISRDITNLGSIGNGNVQVGLNNIAELPYIIGLVRQSLERQFDYTDVAA